MLGVAPWTYTGFNRLVFPTTEAQYKAYGMLTNDDGVLDARDTRVKVGRFKAGTDLSFFQHLSNWHRWTAYTTKDVATDTFWSTTQHGFFTNGTNYFWPQTPANVNAPACSNVGKGINNTKTLAGLLEESWENMPGADKRRSIYLKFDLSWPPPQSIAEKWVAGNPVVMNGNDCAYVDLSFKGGGGSSYPYSWTQGLIPTQASNTLTNVYGLTFSGIVDAGQYSQIFDNFGNWKKYDFNQSLWLTPVKDAFSTLLAFESHGGAIDLDFNDNMYLIETRGGGVVQMNATSSPSASLTANQFITTATIKVLDTMPSASCGLQAGDSKVDYFISPDGGKEWVHVTEWDLVRDTSEIGTKIKDWTPGSTPTTYREATVSFISLAVIGNRLVWKGELMTADKTCSPKISSVKLSYNASGPRSFAHTTPVPLSNVIYDANFKWDGGWIEKKFRGHVYSTRLYDPVISNMGISYASNWDAGAEMGGTASNRPTLDPRSRKIMAPDMLFFNAVDEVVTLSSGTINGVDRTFKGKLANPNTVAGSIEITGVDSAGRRETFTDSGVRTLDGSLVGTGSVNRGTGDFTVTFTRAPGSGTKIKATYKYYTFNSKTPILFNNATVNRDLLGLDDTAWWTNTGLQYKYDFNGDFKFDGSDGAWLINWVQGFRVPQTTIKEWFLGAVDHSTPAVVGAPGLQGWYYGSDIADDERESFDQFRCEQRKRRTQLYMGSRSGMLHSIYAGEFRPYFVDETLLTAPFSCDFSNKTNLHKFRGDFAIADDTGAINPKGPVYTPPGTTHVIDINRGYYEWPDAAGPNYGDGTETFSLIPPNLVSRLKNEQLKIEDKAYMDAAPVAAHVRFADGTWHNVVIVAQGNGGDHVMAVDVTDVNNPVVLWDYADPDLFRSRSAPSVGSVGRVVAGGNSQWVVMFVSGMNADPHSYPKVYMLEVETGVTLYQLKLDTDAEALGATPSGQPALLDSDGNGYADRWFIGTDKGVVFKGIMPDNPLASTGTNFGICTFFKTDIGVKTKERLAIYASPSVTSTNTVSASGELEYKINVFFGTSSSPYHSDDPGDTYYFYTIRDTDDKTRCTYGDELWKLALPAGHQVYSAAFATAGRVYFGTSTATSEDPCAPTSATSNGDTGSIFVYDVEPDASGNANQVAEIATGNTAGSLVVDDKHLYFRTADGRVIARGGKTFQNETKQGGFSEAVIISWMEVLR